MIQHQLDEEQWEREYRPLTNHISDNASFNDTMFETFGEELEFVLSQSPNKVWTYISGDDGSYIVAGYHHVNRLGYFITEKEWESEALFIVIQEEKEYTVTITATYFVRAEFEDIAIDRVYEALLGNDDYDILGCGEVDLSSAKVVEGTHFTIEHP